MKLSVKVEVVDSQSDMVYTLDYDRVFGRTGILFDPWFVSVSLYLSASSLSIFSLSLSIVSIDMDII